MDGDRSIHFGMKASATDGGQSVIHCKGTPNMRLRATLCMTAITDDESAILTLTWQFPALCTGFECWSQSSIKGGLFTWNWLVLNYPSTNVVYLMPCWWHFCVLCEPLCTDQAQWSLSTSPVMILYCLCCFIANLQDSKSILFYVLFTK